MRSKTPNSALPDLANRDRHRQLEAREGERRDRCQERLKADKAEQWSAASLGAKWAVHALDVQHDVTGHTRAQRAVLGCEEASVLSPLSFAT
jgi:hypothetical protein